jgi:hypothetical protein
MKIGYTGILYIRYQKDKPIYLRLRGKTIRLLGFLLRFPAAIISLILCRKFFLPLFL